MTTTKIDLPTPDQKEQQRREIAKQVEDYLAKGGKITQLPSNAYTDLDVEGKIKRVQREKINEV